jgi:hypothetical protein
VIKKNKFKKNNLCLPDELIGQEGRPDLCLEDAPRRRLVQRVQAAAGPKRAEAGEHEPPVGALGARLGAERGVGEHQVEQLVVVRRGVAIYFFVCFMGSKKGKNTKIVINFQKKSYF